MSVQSIENAGALLKDHRLLGSGRRGKRMEGGFLPLLLGGLAAANAAKSLFGLGKKGRKTGGFVGIEGIDYPKRMPWEPKIMYARGKSGGLVGRSGGVKKYRKGQRHMKAGGFFDWIGDAAKTVGNIIPTVIEAVPKVLETAGQAANLYRTVRGGKKAKKVVAKKSSGSDGRAKRAALVKQTMKQHNLSLPAASKYVKAHNMY
jgi:hypothetical protein